MKIEATLLGYAFASLVLSGLSIAQDSREPKSQKLEQLSQGLVGRIGVAAQLIGGDEVVSLNGDEMFVMASTVKIAVAVALLDRVDRGELELGQLEEISQDMMAGGDSLIAQNFIHPGIQLSVANLIEVMITESDNTATDVCIRLAGGPSEITKKLRSIGINDQRSDRRIIETLQDFYNLPAPATASVPIRPCRLRLRLRSRKLPYHLQYFSPLSRCRRRQLLA